MVVVWNRRMLRATAPPARVPERPWLCHKAHCAQSYAKTYAALEVLEEDVLCKAVDSRLNRHVMVAPWGVIRARY